MMIAWKSASNHERLTRLCRDAIILRTMSALAARATEIDGKGVEGGRGGKMACMRVEDGEGGSVNTGRGATNG